MNLYSILILYHAVIRLRKISIKRHLGCSILKYSILRVFQPKQSLRQHGYSVFFSLHYIFRLCQRLCFYSVYFLHAAPFLHTILTLNIRIDSSLSYLFAILLIIRHISVICICLNLHEIFISHLIQCCNIIIPLFFNATFCYPGCLACIHICRNICIERC